MATTAPAQIPITVLPPGPERPDLHFDQSLAIKSKYPVSARLGAGGEIESTGISFGDYQGMHTQLHKLDAYRRIETPEWAVNPDKMRQLLVEYMEDRAGLGSKQTGTDEERLERAKKHLVNRRRAFYVASVDRMCREYVSLKQIQTEEAQARRRALEIQIENLDTQLRIDTQLVEIVLGVIYRYYGCGHNSVEVAEAVHIKPPHVRQILWRLKRTWQRMQAGPKPKKPYRGRVDGVEAMAMRAAGKSYREIGDHFGINAENVIYALKKMGSWQPPTKKSACLK